MYTSELQGKVLNTFDPNSLPYVSSEYSSEGKRDIEFFTTHWSCLLGHKAEVLFDFIAHLAQFPGQKIGWMPIIQSIPGLGKSKLGELIIHHILGHKNVGYATQLDITSDYNSWALDKILIILEEIDVQGPDSNLVKNTLKTLITNQYCRRVQKYRDNNTVLNLGNYIAFTNSENPLPFDHQERRMLMLTCKIKSLDHLEKITSIDRYEYFNNLARISSGDYKLGGELKKYFLEYKLSNEMRSHFLPQS